MGESTPGDWIAFVRRRGAPVKERYIPIRPGIEEHLVRGAMSLCEFGVYALIHIQADYRTGIWRGSAPRILATAPRGASLRQVQRALEHFEEMGYLKSFRFQGARGNAPYLIDKFTVRSGALRGYRVNASKSESWQRPFYELVAEDVAEGVTEGVAEHDALSRSKKKEVREKKEPTAQPAPPADPRYGPFLEFAKGSFEAKHKHPPTWDYFGKDGSALAAFLRRAAHVTLEMWQVHVLNFFDSTEAFTAKQGGSLAYFVSRFDTFSSGPILEGGSNGNGRAKHESFDEKRRRESAAAISEMHNRAVSMVRQVDRHLPDASSNADADGNLRRSIVRSNPRPD